MFAQPHTHGSRAGEPRRQDPAFQAFWLLRIGFTVAPILFGVDKFTNLLADWETYLAPQVSALLGAPASTLMYLVGAIEIIAGLVVLVRPRSGGYLVAAWLAGIIANLLLLGGHHDIALRDFGLMIAALSLARLAPAFPARADRDVTSSRP